MASEPAYVSTQAGPTLTRDGKAFVRDAKGKLYQVDPGDVDRLLAESEYLPASAEQVAEADVRAANSTLKAKAKTFAESAVAGAIDAAQLPISLPARAVSAITGLKADPLENISGRATIENAMAVFGDEKQAREYSDAARVRADVNPGTATAGRLGGEILGGLGVSGGLRQGAAVAAKALGGSTAARLATGAAAGAIEGAGFGAAQASEDAYISNAPLTAEKMVAAMGWGAMLGGAVGLGAEGLSLLSRRGSRGDTPFDSPRLKGDVADAVDDVAAGAATEAATKANRLQQTLRDFAEERTVKALGARGSDLKKLGRTAGTAEKQMRQMARDVLEHKLDDGTPVFRSGASADELAGTTGRAQQELGQRLEKIRDMADEVIVTRQQLAPKPREIASRIRHEVIDPISSSPLAAIRSQAAPLEQLAQDVEDAVMSVARPSARGRIVGAGDSTTLSKLTELRQGLDEQIYQAKRGVNLAQQGAAPNLKALERARWIIEESIEATVDKAAQHFDDATAKAYKATKVKFRSMKLANEIAGAATLQDLGNRVVSPSDYLTGMAAFAGDMAGGGGALSAVRGMAVGAAHKAVRENASSVLAVLADRLARNVDTKLDSGISGFLNTAARTFNKPGGSEIRSSGGRVMRIPETSSVSRAARTPTAIELFQGRDKSLQSAYRNRVSQIIRSTSNNGEGVRVATERSLGALPAFAPKLAQAAVVTTTRGAEYLKLHIPAGLIAPTVYAPSRQARASDLDIAAFARRWSAVANPMSVISDLQRGTVTREQVDALKNVYPALYGEVQVKVLDRLRELDARGASVPFDARLKLDILLDLNGAGDPSLEPGFIARLSQLTEQKRAQQAQQRPPSKPINLAQSRVSGADQLLGDTV